jgi:hypothetical protein
MDATYGFVNAGAFRYCLRQYHAIGTYHEMKSVSLAVF